jgi:uncharacterized RDD family membrane protein YckC
LNSDSHSRPYSEFSFPYSNKHAEFWEAKFSKMISHPAQPDPIDTLLEKISKEAEHEEKQTLAGFIPRAIARIVDTAIVFAFAYGAQLFFVQFVRSDNTYNVEFIVKSVEQAMPAFALILWVIIYSPLMESTGGTIGKRLMRIHLVDLNSRELPLFRMCMARSWIYLILIVLAGVPAILSCLAFFVSDYHQTWHDKLTNMICVKN